MASKIQEAGSVNLIQYIEKGRAKQFKHVLRVGAKIIMQILQKEAGRFAALVGCCDLQSFYGVCYTLHI